MKYPESKKTMVMAQAGAILCHCGNEAAPPDYRECAGCHRRKERNSERRARILEHDRHRSAARLCRCGREAAPAFDTCLECFEASLSGTAPSARMRAEAG